MGNELSGHFLPDEGDLRPAFVIRVSYVAAGFGFLHVHVGDVGRYSTDINVIQRLRFQADLAAGSRLQANGPRQSHAVAQSLKVLPSDVSVATHRLEEVLLIGDDGEPHHKKDIGSEISNPILNVKIRPSDNRHDHPSLKQTFRRRCN